MQLLSESLLVAGVERSAVGYVMPLRGGGFGSSVSLPEGGAGGRETPGIIHAGVSAAFFVTFDIPLVRGRILAGDERPGSVAVINESMANRLWPDQSPLGLTLADAPQPMDQKDSHKIDGPERVVAG
jgi:hypothetical protein